MPPPPPDRVAARETAPQPRADANQDGGGAQRAASGVRLHDGFYLRVGLGANYSRAFVQTKRQSLPDFRLVGTGSSIELWIGRTVPPGYVIGFNTGAFSLSSDAAEIGAEGSASARSLGLHFSGFLDAYPNPRDGYHFGGSLGVAVLVASSDAPETSDYAGSGLGFSAFAGYDAWLGPQFSVGGLLRLFGAVTDGATLGRESTEKGTTYGAQLLLTALYH